MITITFFVIVSTFMGGFLLGRVAGLISKSQETKIIYVTNPKNEAVAVYPPFMSRNNDAL